MICRGARNPSGWPRAPTIKFLTILSKMKISGKITKVCDNIRTLIIRTAVLTYLIIKTQ